MMIAGLLIRSAEALGAGGRWRQPGSMWTVVGVGFDRRVTMH
jgi:hypothetical protein